MGEGSANEPVGDEKLERYVNRAVEQIALDSIKEAALRSFPVRKERYRDQLFKYLLGPVAVGTLIAGAFSFFASFTVSRIQDDQQKRELRHAENIGVYLKYKQAHRARLLQGSMLGSALSWGFTTEMVNERKRSYDAVFLKTNEIFPDARDYLGRVVVPAGLDSKETFRNTIEKLRDVTVVHDLALTAAYSVRNDWDQAIWTDRLRQDPQLSLYRLKRERDCKVGNTLKQYRFRQEKYNTTALKNIYTYCSDVVFKKLDEAIFKETSSAVDVFATWQKETTDAVGKACSLEEAKVTRDVTDDCSKLAMEPATPGLSAFQAKRW
ncbi:hypothetical protein [Pseudomonas piscis]|uniref:hypothetical protein n=1 Tax=Pseudomonas piscis TaxID=2614538 RepID=UPI0003B7247D|nr:hypothetical protein [Pseudomonas piscis]ERO65489.1 hypothetical protein P308_19075 [Pseudomonas piscis]